MTTIKDVAKAAGVSFKTVSRVINDQPHVRDSVRQRVWQAIEELDYRPNFTARQLRTQKSNALALITDEIAITPYAVDIIKGASKAAWQRHKLLLVVNTERNPEMKDEAINLMLERQIEGIIYATMYHRQAILPEAVHKVPTVLLDCFDQNRSLPSVVPNEVNGGYTATRALLDKGHRRIGFVQYDAPIPASSGRLQGYRQALAEFDIPFDPDLVDNEDSPDPENGYRSAMRLMALPDLPTALFCFNDRMAAGVYSALYELNYLIPDDVAVIGFDNQIGITTALRPGLTTLQLPHYEMGRWAVDHLLGLINDPDRLNEPPVQHTLDCPLVVRASV